LKNLTRVFGVVIIRSDDEPVEIKARIEITKELVFSQGAGVVTEIWSRGSGRLARMLSVMYIGDFASIYLGVLYGVDPTSMSIIEGLKRRLGDRLKKTDEFKRRVEVLLAQSTFKPKTS
jgi:glucose/mannose-6-phosphate isomerase